MLFTIRDATSEDEPELCALFTELDDFHAQALPHIFRMAERRASLEFTRQRLARISQEGGVLFVATHRWEVVGFVQVTTREAPDLPIMIPRRYAMVENMAVKQGFRRQGAGAALMERAHEWARDMGLEQLEVHVYNFNREAAALYSKLGYGGLSTRLWRAT
jgi:GNAT superfamily N-acetyltransferase